MKKRRPASHDVRGLLQAVCDQPGTSGSTRLVFGEILRAGLMTDNTRTVQPVSRTTAKPQPGWRYVPLLHLPQMSDERWLRLSTSQAQAIELLKDGATDAALLVLQAGTWRHPEEELRRLLIHVDQECKHVDDTREEGAA